MNEQISSYSDCQRIIQAHHREHTCHLKCGHCPFKVPAKMRELSSRGITEAVTSDHGVTLYPLMYTPEGKIEAMIPVRLGIWTWKAIEYEGAFEPKMEVLVDFQSHSEAGMASW